MVREIAHGVLTGALQELRVGKSEEARHRSDDGEDPLHLRENAGDRTTKMVISDQEGEPVHLHLPSDGETATTTSQDENVEALAPHVVATLTLQILTNAQSDAPVMPVLHAAIDIGHATNHIDRSIVTNALPRPPHFLFNVPKPLCLPNKTLSLATPQS